MGMGGSDKASQAAAAADAQRQAQIQQSVGAVNRAYSSPTRQAQYDTYGANLQNYYTTQVNNQQGVNARNLKFADARSGLTGGSAAVDANTQLNKDYTQGLLQASQQAQAGKASLQQSDTQAKNQLISMVQQGNYTGSIPQETSFAQAGALDSAKNYGNANSLGNLFQGTAGIYNAEQTAAANRKAQMTPIGSPYAGKSPFA